MTFADLSPLANHLWQSTLFAAVAWLLTLALRKNRAAVRYWIWLAASVKFLIPFSLLVSAGAQLGWRTAPASRAASVLFRDGGDRPALCGGGPTPLPAVAAPALNPLPAILFGVWLCGIAVGAVFWLRWWRRIRAIRRAATPLPLNLPIPSDVLARPSGAGRCRHLKPVLLLPEGITDRLTPAAVGGDSGARIAPRSAAGQPDRRDPHGGGDPLLVPSAGVVDQGTAGGGTRAACDEGVLRLGSEPQVYAESILKVCEFYLASPVACAAGVTGGELEEANRKHHDEPVHAAN